MQKQLGLFEAPTKESWVESLWASMSPEVRREVTTILAEMGRAAAKTPQSITSARGGRDEP